MDRKTLPPRHAIKSHRARGQPSAAHDIPYEPRKSAAVSIDTLYSWSKPQRTAIITRRALLERLSQHLEPLKQRQRRRRGRSHNERFHRRKYRISKVKQRKKKRQVEQRKSSRLAVCLSVCSVLSGCFVCPARLKSKSRSKKRKKVEVDVRWLSLLFALCEVAIRTATSLHSQLHAETQVLAGSGT